MENASKALIIAGAILISILLISVAIMIISSTQGTQDQMAQQMDATEKSTFNAQFTSYIGAGRSASHVKSLFERVTANNSSNPYKVKMYVSTTTTASTTEATAATIAGLDSKIKYKIEISDTDSDGLYDKVSVVKN